MARPFTLRQAVENQAFLEVLRQTGNARLAARTVRRRHSTMFHRRSGHAGFAQDWDAALAAAHARFHLGGGKRGPEGLAPAGAGAGEKGKVDSRFRGNDGPSGKHGLGGKDGLSEKRRRSNPLRTEGGEAVVVRTRSGKLQLRFAQRGRLTRAAEQIFLQALSATANIRLSAAAAGASPRAFYRRRLGNPGFAREYRLALRMGYERLEAAALAAGLPESHADDSWRRGEPAPMPRLTFDQVLQLLALHQKSVRQSWEQPHRRRRRGEPWEVYSERLRAMWTSEKALEAEAEALRRAAQYEGTGEWRFDFEAPLPELPALEHVTGWSRADPAKTPHDPDLALFGGWRMKQMKARLAGKG